MKRVILLLLFALATHLSLLAQPEPIEWGRLSPSDLSVYKYDQDTTIPAIVLCDFGKLSIEVIDNDYRVVLRHIKRLKIFSKAGYPEANIEISFNKAENESVVDIRAESITPLPGGGYTITQLKESDILEKQVDDVWSRKVFAIPAVAEGSVIEYSYTLISDDFFNYKSWSFQSQLPCLWSELRAELSGVYNYLVLLHNVRNNLFINEKSESFKTVPDQLLPGANISVPIRIKSTKGRYVMKDIPPLVEEPFITCLLDYKMEVMFQLYSISKPYVGKQNVISSWSELVLRLNEDYNFGKWTSNTFNLRELTLQLTRDKTSPHEKMIAIYDYLRTHFRWNGEYRILAKSTLKEVLNQHSGNSAEINLLMLQMLKLAGLNASPVILSTRSHGRLQKDFPILNQFNHVICELKDDSGKYLLDAIDPYRPFSLLSVEDINSTGLIIDGSNFSWTTIENLVSTQRNTLLSLKIDSFGNVHGYLVLTETGHFACTRRRIMDGMEKAKLADYLLNFLNMDINVDSFNISQQYDIRSPLKIVISFSAKKVIEDMFQKEELYFGATLAESFHTNPFKQSHRFYPVDFSFPYEESSVLVVQIPKGYTFQDLPDAENYIVPDESACFLFQVFNTTKVFQVRSDLQIKKSTYQLSEYPELKQLFEFMVRKNSEQVTAVKNKL